MTDKKVNPNDMTLWAALKESWNSLDAYSWPGVVMFLGLIAIEAGVNIIVSIPDFGIGISIGVGLLFGVFLGMWHILSERPHNSVKQQSTVEFMVAFVSGAAILLIITNLFRLNGNIVLASATFLPTGADFGGWDYFAIAIIGASFAAHLFGYLEWHKADNRRTSMQTYNRNMARVEDADKEADLAGQRAEIRLKCLSKQLEKEKELRREYAGVPADKLNKIIKEHNDEINAAFERTYKIDLDNSGRIGDEKPSPKDNRPEFTPRQQAFAQNTELATAPKAGAGKPQD